MHRRSRLIAASALVLLGGCSSELQLSVPDEAGSPACSAAGALWPDTVAGQSGVTTDPPLAALAAWGDPPITARCGVPPPGPSPDPCLSVDGVDWLISEASDAVVLTTYGREPAIEVSVPAAYGPGTLLLPAFAGAAATLPRNGHQCS